MADADEIVARFEMVQQALQQVDGQLMRLEQNHLELRRALSTLEAVGGGQQEALVPVGAGVHVRALIHGDGPVISPVGRGYAAERDVAGAKQDLEQRIAAAEAALDAKSEEAERLARMARQLAMQLQAAPDAGMV